MAEEKDKIRVLLTDADEVFLRAVEQEMREEDSFEVVGTTSNGEEMWKLFRQLQPQLTVLDTELPYIDGLTLAARIRSYQDGGAGILMVTGFSGGRFYSECELLHIDAVVRKPVNPSTVRERVCLLRKSMERQDLFERRVAALLRELGMPEGTLGYQYTLQAVCLYRETSGGDITKLIYPEIAKRIGTNVHNVERAMRYAIGKVWERCSPELLQKYFGEARAYELDRISNTAFCAAVTAYLCDQEGYLRV
ncbi:MAG: sporulation initiation factor Spo0A C-terminal domain-containing protein [Eubacteriales bacterium]|nr:sporulation initiation factor Spo0A C-terminal domain-containing protein [Eubacteriales bacterium]